jgi:hypothetical protein
MKQLHFQQKYPITVVDIAKTETPFGSVQAIADWLRERIIQTPRVQYIGTFDNFAHTRAIGGEIAPEIQAATNVIFCFGHALPNAEVLAVRPRSIGIADLGDHFVVSFMDAPMKPANDAMLSWALALRNA